MMNEQHFGLANFAQSMYAFPTSIFAHYDNIFFMYKRCNRLRLPIANGHAHDLNFICRFFLDFLPKFFNI
jgi:hypothetical protein